MTQEIHQVAPPKDDSFEELLRFITDLNEVLLAMSQRLNDHETRIEALE